MSWTYDAWSQNDDLNIGYPYVTNSGAPVAPDMSNVKFSWDINVNLNLGYPYVVLGGNTPAPDMTDVKFFWDIKPDKNYGYPFVGTIDNQGAFCNAINLESITIPETVKYIGPYAFYNTKLTEVTIASDCVYGPYSFPANCTIHFYS